MKLLFISSVLAIATSAVAADVQFLRTANRSGKCDWETTRAASSGEDCDDEGEPCSGPGRGSCCAGKRLICNGINSQHAEARGYPSGGHYCEENPGEEDMAAAFEKELKLVEEEDKCIGNGEGGPEGKCGCLTETGGNPDGTTCCGNMICSHVHSTRTKSGVPEFRCSVPGEEDVEEEELNFLRTADPLSQCDWYTGSGSSTRAADTCAGHNESCERTDDSTLGNCCPREGLSCEYRGAANGYRCTRNSDAKDTAAAFEKELKLVEETPGVDCMPQGTSGGNGPCGCQTGTTGHNPQGTPCCGTATCNGLPGNVFQCEAPTAVEIN